MISRSFIRVYQCLDSFSLDAVCHHCQTLEQQHYFLPFVSLECCFTSEIFEPLNNMFASVNVALYFSIVSTLVILNVSLSHIVQLTSTAALKSKALGFVFLTDVL